MHSSKLESWIAFWILEGKLQRFRHKSSWIFVERPQNATFSSRFPLTNHFLHKVRSTTSLNWWRLVDWKALNQFSVLKMQALFTGSLHIRWAYCKQSPPQHFPSNTPMILVSKPSKMVQPRVCPQKSNGQLVQMKFPLWGYFQVRVKNLAPMLLSE